MVTVALTALFLLATGCATRKAATPADQVRAGDAGGTEVLSSILAKYPQYFDTLTKNREKYGLQIIYTRIDREEKNKPGFSHYFLSTASQPYFYPASTVKLPIAILALQRLHELNIPGLDRNSTMVTQTGEAWQTEVYNDPGANDGRPTISDYIKKIFLVSDNDAYNRLYEFLGQEYINQNLHSRGYDSAQILHRLSIVLSEQQNRTTNPVSFYDTAGRLLYSQAQAKSAMAYQQRITRMGSGYMIGNKLVNEPFDFSKKNRLSLADLHSILLSVLFPESVGASKRFNLTDDDYRFLYQVMNLHPRESGLAEYGTGYDDSYVKFLMYGGSGAVDSSIHIFNKVGDAYGFLTDVAYFADPAHGVEFLLSATIYCNSDGVFNDDHYDYKTVGLPFMKNLGRVIYEQELGRPKKFSPDLSNFLGR